MKKTLTLTLAAFAIAAAIPAIAAPDNNAPGSATPSSGTGCYVQGGDGNYDYDPTCSFHRVVNRDKSGKLESFRYHDHGQVLPGMPTPDHTVINDVVVHVNGFTQDCTGREIITPSGEYTSNLTCTN